MSDPTERPASDRCRDWIVGRTSDEIEFFSNSIRPDGTRKSNIYCVARSIGQQIAGDYGSRFLIELIQNAYDAHPPDTLDGRIRILFDPEEADHGVLYVANAGKEFRESNVDALIAMGLSDKPPGESIGNKGLGFRSVLHISEDPQVYSSAGERRDGTFGGFCFRFAKAGDLDRLITDPQIRWAAEEDLPPFRLAVPLEDRPCRVAEFATQGYATVIRLPLRGREAAAAVRTEIAAIKANHAPLMLFLKRLQVVDVVTQGDDELTFTLTRSSVSVELSDGASMDTDDFARVELGPDRSYFLAWHRVAEADVKSAIEDGIQNNQLHELWRDWNGEGEVAVAVSLDDAEVEPLLYTFLPMGAGATSPFRGYLHASFYTEADRTRLHPEVALNQLYIQAAMGLCARTVLNVRKGSGNVTSQLSDEEAARIAVDLLSWQEVPSLKCDGSPSFAISMAAAFGALDVQLVQADVIPIIQRPNAGLLTSHFPQVSAALSSEFSRADEPVGVTPRG